MKYFFSFCHNGRVKVGNEITVLGTKDYWILEKEQAAAEKRYAQFLKSKDDTLKLTGKQIASLLVFALAV